MGHDCFDRWFGGLVSTGLHLCLALGATLGAVEHFVPIGGDGPDFICSVQAREVRIQRIDRSPERFRNETLLPSPVDAILTEEMASAFNVGRQASSGCVACGMERRVGRQVVPQVMGPQGLCCRHVIMMETRCGVDLIER